MYTNSKYYLCHLNHVFAVLAYIQPYLHLFKVPIYADIVGVATFVHLRKMAATLFNPPPLKTICYPQSSTEPEVIADRRFSYSCNATFVYFYEKFWEI